MESSKRRVQNEIREWNKMFKWRSLRQVGQITICHRCASILEIKWMLNVKLIDSHILIHNSTISHIPINYSHGRRWNEYKIKLFLFSLFLTIFIFLLNFVKTFRLFFLVVFHVTHWTFQLEASLLFVAQDMHIKYILDSFTLGDVTKIDFII